MYEVFANYVRVLITKDKHEAEGKFAEHAHMSISHIDTLADLHVTIELDGKVIRSYTHV